MSVAVAVLTGCSHAHSAPPPPPQAHRSTPHRGDRPRAVAHPRTPTRQLLRIGRPIYCGGGEKPYAALTFDDGPGPYTPLALRILRHARVAATFFLVGRNVEPFRASARREVSRRATGVRVRLFRPPYEARNAAVDRTARRLGMVEILWNVDSGDSEGANYAEIARRVTHGIGNGAIVLMHENRGQTIRALKFAILPALRRRHIHLVTVPELLARDPPSAAQLRRGPKGCRYRDLRRGGG